MDGVPLHISIDSQPQLRTKEIMANKSQETGRTEAAISDGLRTIALAADSALKLMAQQASDALKVTTDAAAAQLKIVAEASVVAARAVDAKTIQNNEAIIRIEEGIKGLEKSVKRLEDAEELRKNNPTFTSAHEMRMISLEASRTTQITLTSIGIALLGILSSMMFYHLFSKP